METALTRYEFINSQTGNIIGYLSLQTVIDEKDQLELLKKKMMEVAVLNKLHIEKVYWRKQEQT